MIDFIETDSIKSTTVIKINMIDENCIDFAQFGSKKVSHKASRPDVHSE